MKSRNLSLKWGILTENKMIRDKGQHETDLQRTNKLDELH